MAECTEVNTKAVSKPKANAKRRQSEQTEVRGNECDDRTVEDMMAALPVCDSRLDTDADSQDARETSQPEGCSQTGQTVSDSQDTRETSQPEGCSQTGQTVNDGQDARETSQPEGCSQTGQTVNDGQDARETSQPEGCSQTGQTVSDSQDVRETSQPEGCSQTGQTVSDSQDARESSQPEGCSQTGQTVSDGQDARETSQLEGCSQSGQTVGDSQDARETSQPEGCSQTGQTVSDSQDARETSQPEGCSQTVGDSQDARETSQPEGCSQTVGDSQDARETSQPEGYSQTGQTVGDSQDASESSVPGYEPQCNDTLDSETWPQQSTRNPVDTLTASLQDTATPSQCDVVAASSFAGTTGSEQETERDRRDEEMSQAKESDGGEGVPLGSEQETERDRRGEEMSEAKESDGREGVPLSEIGSRGDGLSGTEGPSSPTVPLAPTSPVRPVVDDVAVPRPVGPTDWTRQTAEVRGHEDGCAETWQSEDVADAALMGGHQWASSPHGTAEESEHACSEDDMMNRGLDVQSTSVWSVVEEMNNEFAATKRAEDVERPGRFAQAVYGGLSRTPPASAPVLVGEGGLGTEEDTPPPLTDEQLATVYYNAELERNDAFIAAFLQDVQPDKHEFYELLLNYYRARNHLASAEHDVAVLQRAYEKQQKHVWSTEEQTVTAQGLCQDRARVSARHTFERAVYSESSATLVGRTLKDIRGQLHDQLALYAYEARLSRLQLEHHMHVVYRQSAALATLPQDTPVSAMAPHEVSSSIRHQVARLKLCITTLFMFHRKPAKDVVFIENVKQWIVKMVSFLLRLASVDDHLYILNHILRCPPGVAGWASRLLQVVPPGGGQPHRAADGPLLDHFLTVFATLLRPIPGRERLLYQLKVVPCVQDKEQDNRWIIVDSDGEEDVLEDEVSWLYLHEADMMLLLNQLPFDSIFKHLLKVHSQQGEERYCGSEMTPGAMLRLLAVARQLIMLLGNGLSNFSLACYRQLNKRLGKVISDTLHYTSDHWSHFKLAEQSLGRVAACDMARLQVEYDELFTKATICILSAQHLGAWQFLADLPFGCLSIDTLWRLAGIMQQRCEGGVAVTPDPSVDPAATPDRGADPVANPDQSRHLILDSHSKQRFEEKLISMPISESTHLLTTLTNMASSRPPSELHFVNAISMQIFEIAYVCEHTRELCSKSARALLGVITGSHPSTLSVLLHATLDNIDRIGTVALYLFQGLPLSGWRPTEGDRRRLRECLLDSPASSHQHQLAALVLRLLNWQLDKQMSALFLDDSFHCWMAVLLVEVYERHLSGKTVFSLSCENFKERGGSVTKDQPITSQSVCDWAWLCMLRLRLHADTRPATPPGGQCGNEALDLNADKSMWAVQVAIQDGCPLAIYAALLITKYGHGISNVCCDGLKMLLGLAEKGHHVAVVTALAALTPQFYQDSHYLTDSQTFTQILLSLFQADVSRLFFGEFPGPIVSLLTNMIQSQIHVSQTSLTGVSAAAVVDFWLRCLTASSKWHADRNVLYVVDQLLKASSRVSGGQKLVQLLFQQLLQKQLALARSPSGVLSSLVSWLAPGAGVPSLIISSVCAEFPWYAYAVLSVDTDHEGALWRALLAEMRVNPSTTIDQSLLVVCQQMALPCTPVVSRLSIYRWAQQATWMHVGHPLLPLVWQAFFRLYLGRNHDDAGFPDRGSLGDRFFESTGYNSMMKKMKKKLKEASDHFHLLVTTNAKMAAAEQAVGSSGHSGSHDSASSPPASQHKDEELYKALVTFYQGLLFWLDEPRLHEAQLYLPALPPQYHPARLLTLFTQNMEPWFELVDVTRVDLELDGLSENWEQRVCPDVTGRHQSPDRRTQLSAEQRILQRLQWYPRAMSPPLLTPTKTPVADVNTTLLCDKHSLLFALRADFNALVEYAKLYALRVSKHVGLDCSFLELLSRLYNNQTTEAVLTASCRSAFGLSHRCKGPAVLTVRCEARTLDEVKRREVDENRAEYKQLMIEALLPPAQNICGAVMHIEHVITSLLNLVRTSGSEAMRGAASEVGVALFYHITTFICEDTKFYPPTRQFFSVCIEILGQELIRGDASQSQPLLQAILQTPALVTLLLPNFNPNASVQLFVTIYDDLRCHIGSALDPAVTFSLLSKFDVNLWLSSSSPTLSQRQALQQAISAALCRCGQTPDRSLELVFEIYRVHLRQLLSYHFPDLYGETLKSIVKGSGEGQLSPAVWEDLLSCLGWHDDQSGQTAGSPRSPGSSTGSSRQTHKMAALSHAQLTETTKWLSSYFLQCRTADRDQATFGLYPTWRPYVPSLARFLQSALTDTCVATVKNAKLGNCHEDEALSALWTRITEVFLPWIQPLPTGDSLLSPWIPDDTNVATAMVASWVATIAQLQDKFQGLLVPFSQNALSILWSYYATTLSEQNVPEHVVGPISSHMIALPWEQFYPDLKLLQQMMQVEARRATGMPLLLRVFTAVDWPNIVQMHCCSPQMAPRFASELLTSLLTLTTRIAGQTEAAKNAGLERQLRAAHTYPWWFVDAESYESITRWLAENYDVRCVLVSARSQSAQCLRLLKTAAQFGCRLPPGSPPATPPTPGSPPTPPPTPGSPSPPACSLKWCAYVRCVAKLIGGCAKKGDIPPTEFHDVITAVMTDMETSLDTVSSAVDQSRAAERMCAELLSVLNGCSARGGDQVAVAVADGVQQWLASRPRSVLLGACLASACRVLASHAHMLHMTETCIDVHFTTSSEWAPVLTSLRVPELSEDAFLRTAIATGSFLTLFVHLLQRMASSRSLEEERDLLVRLLTWSRHAQPTPENASKLLLWWHEALGLLLRQAGFGANPTHVGRDLSTFIASLTTVAEDKASCGLLGAIGLGRRSQLPLRFRLIAKSLVAFASLQLAPGGSLRLPHDGATGGPPASPAVAHLESLRQNRHYAAYREHVDFAVAFVHDRAHTFADARPLLRSLTVRLFPDEHFLKIVRLSPG